jgi:hypothetical protein
VEVAPSHPSFSASASLFASSLGARVNYSELPLAQENLTMLDSTAVEVSVLRESCFRKEMPQQAEHHQQPFELDTSLGFSIGIRAPDVEAAAPTPAFKIVVDAPPLADLKPASVEIEDGSLSASDLPASSFYTSSSGSDHDASVRMAASQAKSTMTPVFLRVPTKRGRRSTSSSSSMPTNHRVSITRAHTNSARTLRTHARYHRKTRDTTGRKKKSGLRIFPTNSTGTAASAMDDGAATNRTLTFDSSLLSEGTEFDATRSLAVFRQSTQQPLGSLSPLTTQKQLTFGDEKLQQLTADELYQLAFHEQPPHQQNNFSASGINLSETFEQMTVLANTPALIRTASRVSPGARVVNPQHRLTNRVELTSPAPRQSVSAFVLPPAVTSPASTQQFSIRDAELSSICMSPPVQQHRRPASVVQSTSTTKQPRTEAAQPSITSLFLPSGAHATPAASLTPASWSQQPQTSSIPSQPPHSTPAACTCGAASSTATQPVAPAQLQAMYVPVQMFMCMMPAPGTLMMAPAQMPMMMNGTNGQQFGSPLRMPMPMQPQAHSLTPMYPQSLMQCVPSSLSSQHEYVAPSSLSAARDRLRATLAKSPSELARAHAPSFLTSPRMHWSTPRGH